MIERLGSLAQVRRAAVRRLLVLDQRGDLSTEHVRVVASCVAVHERTVWRWLEQAHADGRCERLPIARFTLTEELRARLAFWGGNASALHRELVAEQETGGVKAPSLATLHRAIRRDVSQGIRAGIRDGEQARRAFDIRLRRPDKSEGHRNQVWEADHVQAPVWVEVDGRPVRPWITWFIDCYCCAVCGLAVTAGSPSRESILAAARASILCSDRYGEFGGLPEAVRIDQGKDFLSGSVRAALGRFAIPVGVLPGYCPWLKGTVEMVNGAVEKMFFASLPGFAHGAKRLGGKPVDPSEPLLTFSGFVELLLEWVAEWNQRIPKAVLDDRTPQQMWRDDPTPLEHVEAEDLCLMLLEDDGRPRKVSNQGVKWKRRHYVSEDPWIGDYVGKWVRIRYMPHHDHEIEVFDASTGEHLGRAFLCDQASAEQVRQILRARREAAAELERTLKAAARLRRERFAALTAPGPAKRLGALTSAEADAEVRSRDAGHGRPRKVARPQGVALPEPAAGWVLPVQRAAEPESGERPMLAAAGQADEQDPGRET
nr:Mu transposase C-terminal domain-containing protein [Actinomadura soli]